MTAVCLEYSGLRESEEPEASKEAMVSLEETVMMESKADRVRSVQQDKLEYRETRCGTACQQRGRKAKANQTSQLHAQIIIG